MLNIRLETEPEQRLKVLVRKNKYTQSYRIKETLLHCTDLLQTQEKRRQETLERWQAYEQTGATIEHGIMVEWQESWGANKEIPCPSIK